MRALPWGSRLAVAVTLSLTLLVVGMVGLAILAMYRSTPVLTVSTPIVAGTQAAPLNLALESVFDYLRVYSSDQPLPAPAAPRDPATQSALDYIHTHERVERPQRAAASWNQAMQAICAYLRACSQ